ncbi:MAG: FMN-binding protein, partial [Erysipelotrichaceae bacterium]|nr:FMN-binding protein [Erysipelotrichaceae bacterium]
GMGGDIAVKVKIVEGKIESIEIAADNETPDRIAKVVETLIPSIIENQSTEVDVVSSCTLSSNAVIEAVNNAIADSQK